MGAIRCFVCNADITGLLSIPTRRSGETEPRQRSTCYEPEECAERLRVTRDAWKVLAYALRSKNKKRRAEAVEQLRKLGEVT
jgi:hypothetical protein